MRFRLRLMLLLQYGVFSSFTINSLYFIEYLKLSGTQAGFLFSLFGFGAIGGSVLVNRCVRSGLSEAKLQALLNAVAGVTFFCLFFVQSFVGLAIVLAINSLMLAPLKGLLNSLVFRLIERKHEYGREKIFGIAGYIFWTTAISLLVFSGSKPDPRWVYVCVGVIAFCVAAYALTFDSQAETKPSLSSVDVSAMAVSLRHILRLPLVRFILAINLMVALVNKMLFLGMTANLNHLAFDARLIMPISSLNQLIEVVVLFFLGGLMFKLGRGRVILLGLIFYVGLFACFASQSAGFFVLGVALLGCIAPMVTSVSQIILDDQVTPAQRVAMHQLFFAVTIGIGDIVGNVLAGMVFDLLNVAEGHYRSYWELCLLLALTVPPVLYLVIYSARALPRRRTAAPSEPAV